MPPPQRRNLNVGIDPWGYLLKILEKWKKKENTISLWSQACNEFQFFASCVRDFEASFLLFPDTSLYSYICTPVSFRKVPTRCYPDLAYIDIWDVLNWTRATLNSVFPFLLAHRVLIIQLLFPHILLEKADIRGGVELKF